MFEELRFPDKWPWRGPLAIISPKERTRYIALLLELAQNTASHRKLERRRVLIAQGDFRDSWFASQSVESGGDLQRRATNEVAVNGEFSLQVILAGIDDHKFSAMVVGSSAMEGFMLVWCWLLVVVRKSRSIVLIARRIGVSNRGGNEETTGRGRHKTSEQILILFSAG